MNYHFEWDLKKAKSNLKKHHVSFEQAAEIFIDQLSVSIFDDEHSIDEDRWITIGKTKSENVIVVIHTFKEVNTDQVLIRIISARKATKNERKQYSG